MDRRLGLRRDEVHHDAVGLLVVRCVIAALPLKRHADLDHHLAGRRETADLPAIHGHIVRQAVGTQAHLPERRRQDPAHETAGGHGVAVHRGLAGGFVDFLLADAGGMDVGFMRQVHQVVDHQPVIALDVKQAAAKSPGGVVVPLHVRDVVGVRQGRVTGPDPDEPIAFLDREALDRGKAAHALAGHGDRLAVAAHGQTVVAADQFALLHIPEGERRAPVRTEILDGRHLVGFAAVEGDALAADGAAQRLLVDLVGGTGDVPGILRKHDRPLVQGWARETPSRRSSNSGCSSKGAAAPRCTTLP